MWLIVLPVAKYLMMICMAEEGTIVLKNDHRIIIV